MVLLEIPNELLVSLHHTLPFFCSGCRLEVSVQAFTLIGQVGGGCEL